MMWRYSPWSERLFKLKYIHAVLRRLTSVTHYVFWNHCRTYQIHQKIFVRLGIENGIFGNSDTHFVPGVPKQWIKSVFYYCSKTSIVLASCWTFDVKGTFICRQALLKSEPKYKEIRKYHSDDLTRLFSHYDFVNRSAHQQTVKETP